MAKISWLHLSDWHQRGVEFDRQVVLDALLRDIADRSSVHPQLKSLDFCIFTGDLAFHGEKVEFVTALRDFLDPTLTAAGIPKDRLFLVPGNHDQNRSRLDVLPSDLHVRLNSREAVNEWFGDLRRRKALLGPFEEFAAAASDFFGQSVPENFLFGDAHSFQTRGEDARITLICLNSALLCSQHKEGREVLDRGHLALGECQYYEHLEEAEGTDLVIVGMHHPLDWLQEHDRHLAQARLMRQAHFLLHGHNHSPTAEIAQATHGSAALITGGACYDRRIPNHPSYACSYNYVTVDTTSGLTEVLLRRYSLQHGWIADMEALPPGKSGKFSFVHPALRGQFDDTEEAEQATRPSITVTASREDLQAQQIGGAEELSSLGSLAFIAPPKPGVVIGREADVAAVEKALAEFRVVVVEGIAGIGKTEVAATVALHSSDRGWTTLWLECKPNFSLERFDLALLAFAATLPPSIPLNRLVHDKRPIAAKLADVIAELNRAQVLLVFDDFHMANDLAVSALIDAWVRYGSVARLLVLTREKRPSLAKHIGAIREHVLHGLPMESRTSLLERYGLAIGDPILRSRLVDKLDGHPLATALFASLVHTEQYRPEQLLDDYRNLFGEELHRRLFSDVYSGLTQRERRMLGCLSVFRDSIERSGALRLFQASSKERPDAVLRSLSNRFLIRIDADQTVRTHPLIKEFCYSQIVNQQQERAYHFAAARFFVPEEKKFSPQSVERYLEAHFHLVRGGWHQRAIRIVVVSEEYLFREGYNEQLLGMYQAAERDDRPLRFWSHILRARMMARKGHVDAQERILRALLTTDDPGERGILLSEMGNFYLDRGKLSESLNSHLEALAIDEKQGRTAGLIVQHMNIGNIRSMMGQWNEALDQYRKSRALSEKVRDEANVADANIREKDLLWLLRQCDRSEPRLAREQALDIFAQEGDHAARVNALLYLGSEQQIQEALNLADRLGDIEMQIKAKMAVAAHAVSVTREDLQQLELALDQAKQMKAPILQSRVLDEIGDARLALEDLPGARAAYLEAVGLEREMGRPRFLTLRLRSLVACYLAEGSSELAVTTFDDAKAVLGRFGLQHLAAEWESDLFGPDAP